MSYPEYDTSVALGAPIECYKFIGELNTYRYTNNNEDVTVDGELYEHLNITRSAIETSSLLDSIQTIDCVVPITCDMAVAYSFLKMPLTLDVEIKAVHRGTNFATDWKLIWQGRSVSFPVADNYSTIRTQSIIQSSLGTQMNQIIFQTSCNHEVGDEHCTVDLDLFTTTTTVTNIKDFVITVADDGNPDGDLAIGKMVNTRTGETRVIVSNVANVITVGYGFIDIILGDTVDLIIGCDGAYTTCLNVFANLDNNGSCMFLPSTNPYVDPV